MTGLENKYRELHLRLLAAEEAAALKSPEATSENGWDLDARVQRLEKKLRIA